MTEEIFCIDISLSLKVKTCVYLEIRYKKILKDKKDKYTNQIRQH